LSNDAVLAERYDRYVMATRLLVCPPLYVPRDAELDAERQWDRYIELIRCVADVELVGVEPAAQTPDLAFTANAALIVGNLAIVSSFRHAERRRAQPLYRAALARAGFATTFLRQAYFEGAGDALYDRTRPLLYAGYGTRTERAATLQLQEILPCRVLPLMLADERFPHLNTALCPLSSGHVLACLDAFSPYAQQMLRRAVGRDALIEVGLDDALRMSCNALELGDAILMDDCSPRLRRRLHDAGYRVFCTDLGAFHAAGGSAKSLVLLLDDGPGLGVAAATA
jgi:N-dimethylarginine dimethylaminohydrolase